MFVYLIAWRPGGPTKMGIAHDVAARLAELQTACPYRLRVYAAFDCPAAANHAAIIERRVLSTLRALRLEGEWLRLGATQCRMVLANVADGENIPLRRWRATAREAANRARQERTRRRQRTKAAVVDIKTLRGMAGETRR